MRDVMLLLLYLTDKKATLIQASLLLPILHRLKIKEEAEKKKTKVMSQSQSQVPYSSASQKTTK